MHISNSRSFFWFFVLQTSGSVLAHYYTSLVRSHPKYRLSTAPLPERDPPTEPSLPSASTNLPSSQPELSPAVPPSSQPTTNGSTPHSRATSISPSVSSSHSNSASSSSMSVDPSPSLSSSSLPPQRTGQPILAPPSSSSPKLPLKNSRLSSDSTGTSTPPLIPPNFSRRFVSASNLPSPAPRSVQLGGSPHLRGNGAGEGSMLPPTNGVIQSPAKRGRRRSTSSNSSSGGSANSSTNPNTRFAPSPRLSAES